MDRKEEVERGGIWQEGDEEDRKGQERRDRKGRNMIVREGIGGC